MTSPGVGVNAQVFVDITDTQRVLNQLASNLAPSSLNRWLTTQVAPYLQTRAEARFSNQGDDVVGNWSPLADSTISIRTSQGFGAGPINVRTHQMKNFVTGSFGDVAQIGDISVLTWPHPGNYAMAMETKLQTAQGGKPEPATPARPVIGVNEKDNIFVTALLAAHLLGGV